MSFGEEKIGQKPGTAPGSATSLKKPLRAQPAVIQHRFNPRIVPAPVPVKFS